MNERPPGRWRWTATGMAPVTEIDESTVSYVRYYDLAAAESRGFALGAEACRRVIERQLFDADAAALMAYQCDEDPRRFARSIWEARSAALTEILEALPASSSAEEEGRRIEERAAASERESIIEWLRGRARVSDDLLAAADLLEGGAR